MIIDPESFISLYAGRHLAAADAAREVRRLVDRAGPARRPPRRGLVLRLAVWATGRAMHA